MVAFPRLRTAIQPPNSPLGALAAQTFSRIAEATRGTTAIRFAFCAMAARTTRHGWTPSPRRGGAYIWRTISSRKTMSAGPSAPRWAKRRVGAFGFWLSTTGWAAARGRRDASGPGCGRPASRSAATIRPGSTVRSAGSAATIASCCASMGSWASTGGLCIGHDWAGDPTRGVAPWRDTAVEVRGPAVARLEAAFADSWAAAGAPLAPEARPSAV